MLTWRQLGLGEKPCALLDVDGYFAPLLAMIDHMVGEGFLRADDRAALWHGEDAEALLAWLCTPQADVQPPRYPPPTRETR